MRELNRSSDLERFGVAGILDSLADGAYITDTERRILFWNTGAQRIVGWETADVVGKSCQDKILIHVDKDGHELCGQEYCPLHRAIVTDRPSETPLLVFAQHKDGRRIPVEVTVSPLRDEGGRVIGGIEIFRDLSALMADLSRARLIQTHALECPTLNDARVEVETLYTPEGDLGGDFLRVERIAPDRIAAMVADVMGHGVASALYSLRLRALWDELRDRLGHPAEFLQALNRRLHGLVARDGYFATAVFALLDERTGRLQCVRAGQPAPLIVSAAGAVRAIGDRHPALGLLDAVTYVESGETLAPGESLLLFSDGAFEVANPAGVELGETGLAVLVGELAAAGRGPPALARLEERLLAYSDRLRLADDLTFIRLTRRQPGPSA